MPSEPSHLSLFPYFSLALSPCFFFPSFPFFLSLFFYLFSLFPLFLISSFPTPVLFLFPYSYSPFPSFLSFPLLPFPLFPSFLISSTPTPVLLFPHFFHSVPWCLPLLLLHLLSFISPIFLPSLSLAFILLSFSSSIPLSLSTPSCWVSFLSFFLH